jgi:hypothetical protein
MLTLSFGAALTGLFPAYGDFRQQFRSRVTCNPETSRPAAGFIPAKPLALTSGFVDMERILTLPDLASPKYCGLHS